MKSIGAKELRLHLDQILDEVLSGEDIILNHRFKGPVKLTAVQSSSTSSHFGKLAGLAAFDAAPKRKSPFNSSAPVKELYRGSIAKKYAS